MWQLRHIGLVEGTSTPLLFLVAMPLTFAADMPKAVSIVGMIHGVLFTLYVIALIRAALALKRPFKWSAKVFIAAIIPFIHSSLSEASPGRDKPFERQHKPQISFDKLTV